MGVADELLRLQANYRRVRNGPATQTKEDVDEG